MAYFCRQPVTGVEHFSRAGRLFWIVLGKSHR
jgi:hypothetical protein